MGCLAGCDARQNRCELVVASLDTVRTTIVNGRCLGITQPLNHGVDVGVGGNLWRLGGVRRRKGRRRRGGTRGLWRNRAFNSRDVAQMPIREPLEVRLELWVSGSSRHVEGHQLTLAADRPGPDQLVRMRRRGSRLRSARRIEHITPGEWNRCTQKQDRPPRQRGGRRDGLASRRTTRMHRNTVGQRTASNAPASRF